MSLVTVSQKVGRVYRRKFDHDEARERFAAGETASALAREYGVTPTAVLRVLPTRTAETMRRYQESLKGAARCDDCGGSMNKMSRYAGSTRCRTCAAFARATTVRATELRCNACGEWKPDEDFPRDPNRIARRGRRRDCRACNTRLRQAYRERRKVPCVGCGTPTLPPNEKTTRGSGLAQCRSCSSLARMRRLYGALLDHEENLARRRERYRRRIQAGAEDPAKLKIGARSSGPR